MIPQTSSNNNMNLPYSQSLQNKDLYALFNNTHCNNPSPSSSSFWPSSSQLDETLLNTIFIDHDGRCTTTLSSCGRIYSSSSSPTNKPQFDSVVTINKFQQMYHKFTHLYTMQFINTYITSSDRNGDENYTKLRQIASKLSSIQNGMIKYHNDLLKNKFLETESIFYVILNHNMLNDHRPVLSEFSECSQFLEFSGVSDKNAYFITICDFLQKHHGVIDNAILYDLINAIDVKTLINHTYENNSLTHNNIENMSILDFYWYVVQRYNLAAEDCPIPSHKVNQRLIFYPLFTKYQLVVSHLSELEQPTTQQLHHIMKLLQQIIKIIDQWLFHSSKLYDSDVKQYVSLFDTTNHSYYDYSFDLSLRQYASKLIPTSSQYDEALYTRVYTAIQHRLPHSFSSLYAHWSILYTNESHQPGLLWLTDLLAPPTNSNFLKINHYNDNIPILSQLSSQYHDIHYNLAHYNHIDHHDQLFSRQVPQDNCFNKPIATSTPLSPPSPPYRWLITFFNKCDNRATELFIKYTSTLCQSHLSCYPTFQQMFIYAITHRSKTVLPIAVQYLAYFCLNQSISSNQLFFQHITSIIPLHDSFTFNCPLPEDIPPPHGYIPNIVEVSPQAGSTGTSGSDQCQSTSIQSIKLCQWSKSAEQYRQEADLHYCIRLILNAYEYTTIELRLSREKKQKLQHQQSSPFSPRDTPKITQETSKQVNNFDTALTIVNSTDKLIYDLQAQLISLYKAIPIILSKLNPDTSSYLILDPLFNHNYSNVIAHYTNYVEFSYNSPDFWLMLLNVPHIVLKESQKQQYYTVNLIKRGLLRITRERSEEFYRPKIWLCQLSFIYSVHYLLFSRLSTHLTDNTILIQNLTQLDIALTLAFSDTTQHTGITQTLHKPLLQSEQILDPVQHLSDNIIKMLLSHIITTKTFSSNRFPLTINNPHSYISYSHVIRGLLSHSRFDENQNSTFIPEIFPTLFPASPLPPTTDRIPIKSLRDLTFSLIKECFSQITDIDGIIGNGVHTNYNLVNPSMFYTNTIQNMDISKNNPNNQSVMSPHTNTSSLHNPNEIQREDDEEALNVQYYKKIIGLYSSLQPSQFSVYAHHYNQEYDEDYIHINPYYCSDESLLKYREARMIHIQSPRFQHNLYASSYSAVMALPLHPVLILHAFLATTRWELTLNRQSNEASNINYLLFDVYFLIVNQIKEIVVENSINDKPSLDKHVHNLPPIPSSFKLRYLYKPQIYDIKSPLPTAPHTTDVINANFFITAMSMEFHSALHKNHITKKKPHHTNDVLTPQDAFNLATIEEISQILPQSQSI